MGRAGYPRTGANAYVRGHGSSGRRAIGDETAVDEPQTRSPHTWAYKLEGSEQMPPDPPSPASRWLVSTQWLGERLGATSVAIVDGSYFLPAANRDARAEYRAAHIPGAVFFDIDEIADHGSGLPHMLPRPQAFA